MRAVTQERTTQERTRPAAQWNSHRRAPRRRQRPAVIAALILGVALVVGAAGVLYAAVLRDREPAAPPSAPTVRYLGVYDPQVLSSYAGIDQFAQAIGRQPNIVSYYSAWQEPFQAGFAATAARHGAVPLVQINPEHVSLAEIAAGRYDDYLSQYAAAVRSYRRQVIISFGHEMNGYWYSWGHRHTSPAVFVAAWRHIVSLFRTRGTSNVTWMWNINIINKKHNNIPDPAAWWPGQGFVTWVGIDGYYHQANWQFASLFGPTIAAARKLTRDPILIAETGAASNADQPAKITDLFAGVRAYDLLGFLWFNSVGTRDWRVDSPAAVAAFRQGAER
jgi:mannan endo-1,4-beta-mannosidase